MVCRRSIFDIHTDVSSNTGVPLAEHTKEMTVPEFKYIMIQSYKLGLTEFRAFCGLDESMACRVNEVSTLLKNFQLSCATN